VGVRRRWSTAASLSVGRLRSGSAEEQVGCGLLVGRVGRLRSGSTEELVGCQKAGRSGSCAWECGGAGGLRKAGRSGGLHIRGAGELRIACRFGGCAVKVQRIRSCW
jgi:hypothetical protein